MGEELKPCPFCGGDEIHDLSGNEGIICRSCGVQVLSARTMSDHAAWNRRAEGMATVKPLEWKEAGSRVFRAASLVGRYTAIDRNPISEFPTPAWSRDGQGFAHGKTLDEVKAAAQADYERRILSALQTEGK